MGGIVLQERSFFLFQPFMFWNYYPWVALMWSPLPSYLLSFSHPPIFLFMQCCPPPPISSPPTMHFSESENDFNSWHICRNPGIIFLKLLFLGLLHLYIFPTCQLGFWILDLGFFICFFALLMHIVNFKYCFFYLFLINKRSRPINYKMYSIYFPRTKKANILM